MKPQTGRYLELNGDRIGVPYWKNLILSSSFFGAVVGFSTFSAVHDENNDSLRDAFLTSCGMYVSLRAMSHIPVKLFSSPLSKNRLNSKIHVIDTSPTQRASQKQRDLATSFSLGTGIIGITYIANIPYVGYHIISLEGELAGLLIYTCPFSANAISLLKNSYNIARGKWQIVNKDDMTLEEEPETSPIQALAPAPIRN